jgi:hypothetical protein
LQFLAKNADSAFNIQETTDLFCHIIDTALVNASDLERQLQFLMIKENELSSSAMWRPLPTEKSSTSRLF